MSKFKSGDLVDVKNKGLCIFNSHWGVGSGSVNVTDDKGLMWIVDESALQLVHPPQVSLDDQFNLFGDVVPELYKPPCFHEWVSYFGMNERYKFCKKCDKKEGHL
jgi:hypothetical protein